MATGLSTDAIRSAVESAHAAGKDLPGGVNASYIPYLAKVPSSLCGLAVATVDGELFEAGDTRFEFAIESISKVFTLCRVIDEIGAPALRQKVGAEPTGAPFNSVIAIELHKGKALSPLVNAGAMSTASLVTAATRDEHWQKILDTQSDFAGRPIALNDEVFKSESDTNFHNRAIAWLLYSYGTMYCEPMRACDVYTAQCSTAITTVDLAVMGATLANGGVNPRTGRRCMKAENVPHVLAEMTMEGLYDTAGDWFYQVGLPGKSGVGGGIVAVAPGKCAIAGFSPPLDPIGNSVRGQAMVKQVAAELGLSVLKG
ncbi:MAG: glutaminase A [Geminicoccaceae bacterium]